MMISLAILVALAGLATTFTNGLLSYLDRSMRADYLLLPEALVLGQANAGAGPEFAERVRTTPGIAAVTTLRRGEVQISGAAAQIIGIDPVTYPELAGLAFSAGSPERAFAQLAEGRFVIVNGMLAAQHGITVGQDISVQTVNGPQVYRVVGVGIDYLNSRVATAYISQTNLASDWNTTDDILLMANRSDDAQASDVEAALLQVTRDYPAFSLLSYETWRAEQRAANQTRTNIMYVLMGLLAIPSLLALGNTLTINVLERTREIGMLRAIGSTRLQVQRMIVAESVLLAALGTVFGIIGGIWLGYALVGAMNGIGLTFAYVFPVLGIVVAMIVGVLFGLLAAWLPARHATKLNIVAALRYD
jgi:putative ABC transport system permease protein